MNLLFSLLFSILLVNTSSSIVSQIISPKNGERIFRNEIHIHGQVSNIPLDKSSLHYICCWDLTSRFLQETQSYCSKYDEDWNDINKVEVSLPNRGHYEVVLSVFKVSHIDQATVHPIHDLVSQSELTTFTFEIHPNCQISLRDRKYVQLKYYDRMLLESSGSVETEGVTEGESGSFDLERDLMVNFDRTPLCYDDWIFGSKETRDSTVRSMIGTTSASRGTFGVDFSMQQFGHGDTMMLDFVLDRHRHAPPHFVELGTFGGVTSLYLGMASRLRGGLLDTFDISDDRSSGVKLAWLPNMMFHLGDVNRVVEAVDHSDGRELQRSTLIQAVEAIKRAGVVLVDHVDRLNFTMNVVVPNLRHDGVILVHDFPPESTSEQMWNDMLYPFNIVRRYDNLQHSFESCLAVFTFTDSVLSERS